jgi:hypothetical protein
VLTRAYVSKQTVLIGKKTTDRILEIAPESGILRPRDLEAVNIPRAYLSRLSSAKGDSNASEEASTPFLSGLSANTRASLRSDDGCRRASSVCSLRFGFTS